MDIVSDLQFSTSSVKTDLLPTMAADEKTYQLDAGSTEISDVAVLNAAREAKLVRKIDLYLIPALGLLYLVAFLDRSVGRLILDFVVFSD